MHQTKCEYKERAITKKFSKQELKFMCTTLPLDEIFPPKKFDKHLASIVLEICTGQNSSMKIKTGQQLN